MKQSDDHDFIVQVERLMGSLVVEVIGRMEGVALDTIRKPLRLAVLSESRRAILDCSRALASEEQAGDLRALCVDFKSNGLQVSLVPPHQVEQQACESDFSSSTRIKSPDSHAIESSPWEQEPRDAIAVAVTCIDETEVAVSGVHRSGCFT